MTEIQIIYALMTMVGIYTIILIILAYEIKSEVRKAKREERRKSHPADAIIAKAMRGKVDDLPEQDFYSIDAR